MATQRPVVAMDIATFSARLLELREVAPRARLIAQAIVDLLPGTAANVYLLAVRDDEQVWSLQATAGDVSVPDASVPFGQGALGVVARNPEPTVFSGKDLAREEYSHLHVRKTLHSLAYLPLKPSGNVIGAIEILSFDDEVRATLLALQPMADVAGS